MDSKPPACERTQLLRAHSRGPRRAMSASEGWAGSLACDEMREIFGPVLAVMPFEEEGIARADAMEYGLAADPHDVSRARRALAVLQAGTIRVNRRGGTDAASPFGGTTQSGYGRGMGAGAIALHAQTKSIWLH